MLPERVAIVATDLNQPMLDLVRPGRDQRPVQWRQADAMQLPFPERSFDAVVCQFGVMFFPDRGAGLCRGPASVEAGGAFIFNVWDRIEENEFADTVTTALADRFPKDPPRFLARTPHGYHDHAVIERDLAKGGFRESPHIGTVAARSRAESARFPASRTAGNAAAQRNRDPQPGGLGEATDLAAHAIARLFGRGV